MAVGSTGCGHCGEEYLHKLCVHRVPIFSFLERGGLVHIASLIRHRKYGKREMLFSEGDFFGKRNLPGRQTAAYITEATEDGR